MRGVKASRIFAYCEDGLGTSLSVLFFARTDGIPERTMNERIPARWTTVEQMNGFRTNEWMDNERTDDWPSGIPDWMTQTIQRLGFPIDRMTDQRLTDSWLTIDRLLTIGIPRRANTEPAKPTERIPNSYTPVPQQPTTDNTAGFQNNKTQQRDSDLNDNTDPTHPQSQFQSRPQQRLGSNGQGLYTQPEIPQPIPIYYILRNI